MDDARVEIPVPDYDEDESEWVDDTIRDEAYIDADEGRQSELHDLWLRERGDEWPLQPGVQAFPAMVHAGGKVTRVSGRGCGATHRRAAPDFSQRALEVC